MVDVRATFKNISVCKRELDNKRNKLLELKCQIYGLSAMRYDQDRIMSSGDMDKIGKLVAKKVDLEHDIEESSKVLTDLKLGAYESIKALDKVNYQKVLYKRGIEGKSVQRTARELKISERHCKRLYYDALTTLDERQIVEE